MFPFSLLWLKSVLFGCFSRVLFRSFLCKYFRFVVIWIFNNVEKCLHSTIKYSNKLLIIKNRELFIKFVAIDTDLWSNETSTHILRKFPPLIYNNFSYESVHLKRIYEKMHIREYGPMKKYFSHSKQQKNVFKTLKMKIYELMERILFMEFRCNFFFTFLIFWIE